MLQKHLKRHEKENVLLISKV